MENFTARGVNNRKERLIYHLWKFIGRYMFKLMFLPTYRLRRDFLRLFGAKIGKGTSISNHAIIVNPAWLVIGRDVCIDDYVYFNAKAEIRDNVSITSFVKIISGGHNLRSLDFTYIHKPVIIYEKAFVGAASVIMGGGENWYICSNRC